MSRRDWGAIVQPFLTEPTKGKTKAGRPGGVTTRFLRFVELAGGGPGVTRRWKVLMRIRGGELGVVEWYARWHQYVFVPAANAAFSAECLDDLARFCTERTAEFWATER